MSAEISSQPPSSAVDDDAVVHPAGTHHKASFRWGYFLLLNAIAAVIAVGIFFAIARGDVLDPYMAGTYAWLLAHPMATSLMAFSPLLASMLVGWGYSQRARKRRAAAAEAQRISAQKAAVGSDDV
jgi:hypothetical protein